jgi:sugar phosphate isomerase/epimerase
MTTTRRLFITSAFAAAAASRLNAVAPSATHKFPTDPVKRIAVATYPFRRMILAPGNDERDSSKPGMDLAAFARFIRSEFKVYGIEPLHAHFQSTKPDYILSLRRQFDAAGVFVANIPVDAPVDLCSPDPATRDAGNATYRNWIDIAKVLSSPSVRVWIPKCPDTSDIAKAANALKPSIEYARGQGIIMNLENDDPVLDSASRVVKVIEQAGSPFLRALPDFGNGLMGGDEAFNAASVKMMFQHALNIAHVKDAEDVKGQRRTASLAQLFNIAKASGYRGYYSMESDSSVDPTPDTKHLIHESLRLMV